MTADLSALIARLEAAEVGSRELDYAIKAWLEPIDDYWGIRVAADWTTSLDAALALAERVLGEDQALEVLADEGRSALEDTVNGCLKRLPIDVCIAILRAKLDGYEAEGGVNQIKAKAQGEGHG